VCKNTPHDTEELVVLYGMLVCVAGEVLVSLDSNYISMGYYLCFRTTPLAVISRGVFMQWDLEVSTNRVPRHANFETSKFPLTFALARSALEDNRDVGNAFSCVLI
jgi:hypothetical protein